MELFINNVQNYGCAQTIILQAKCLICDQIDPSFLKMLPPTTNLWQS